MSDHDDDLDPWADLDEDLERRHRLSQGITDTVMEALSRGDNLDRFLAGRIELLLSPRGIEVAVPTPGGQHLGSEAN